MPSNLHQFLVGAASSREKKSLYCYTSYDRGWKPLPQSISLKLPLLNLGSNKVSSPIKLAALLRRVNFSGQAALKPDTRN